MNLLRSMAVLGLLLLSFGASATDRVSYQVPIQDTREILPRGEQRESYVEVNEIPYSGLKPRGVMLMIPGFFQNDVCLDLMPENDVSIARYLM